MIKIGIAEKDGITLKLLRELLCSSGACVRCITHCRCDDRTLQTVQADYLLMPTDVVCSGVKLDLILSVNAELCDEESEAKVLLENHDSMFGGGGKMRCNEIVKFGMGRECDITVSSIGETDNGVFVSCCVQRRIDAVLGNSADIGEYAFRIYGSNPPTACVLGACAAYIMCQNTKKGETLLLY